MPAPWHLETEHFAIRKVVVGRLENNVYVVACRRTEAAVIIDAAAEPGRILAETSDVRPVAILTTHGHFDHVGAARQVAAELGIPVRLDPADAGLAGFEPDEPLVAGPTSFGDVTIEVVPTPGHTPGSICLLLPGVALTGDTLFPGGPGGTGSPGSSFTQIIDSIERRLLALPGGTLVMPGHGLDTTIGHEAPRLDEWRRRGW